MIRVALVLLLGAAPAAARGMPLVPAAETPAGAGSRALIEVVDDGGTVLFRAGIDRDARWCLVWNHSVTGIEVADCFRQDGGRLLLARSHQPDFAAGLGDIPGRGRVVSDGAGGYWIEDIDMGFAGDALPLRVGGPAVDHRLCIGGVEHSLTGLAAGRRVTLRLRFPDGPAG